MRFTPKQRIGIALLAIPVGAIFVLFLFAFARALTTIPLKNWLQAMGVLSLVFLYWRSVVHLLK